MGDVKYLQRPSLTRKHIHGPSSSPILLDLLSEGHSSTESSDKRLPATLAGASTMSMPVLVLLALVAAVSGQQLESAGRTLKQVDWNRYPSFPWCNCDRTTVTPFALRYVGMSIVGSEQFACFDLFLASVPFNPSPCYSMDLYKIEFDIGAPRFNSRGTFNGSNIAMSWHAGPSPRSVIKFTQLSVTQAAVASAPGGSIRACFTVPIGSTLTSLSATGGESITYAIFNAPASSIDCCPVG
ncbi:pherophorin-C3 protein, partial [Haematococcus lacustris]